MAQNDTLVRHRHAEPASCRSARVFPVVSYDDPAQLATTERVLAISRKKAPETLVPYLSQESTRHLLAQPSGDTMQGRRDAVLLSLLYDSGARTRTGRFKGGRCSTRDAECGDLDRQGVETPYGPIDGTHHADHPLFFNSRREPLTRWRVTYVLQKYVTLAQSTTDLEFPANVSPHVLRRSKAVHMLQSRVNLIYLRDFLGHRDITTTQIYARVGTETRRRALKATRIPGLIRLHQLCRLTALPDQV